MTAETIIQNGVVPSVCRQCDWHCGIHVHIENGRMVKITAMPNNPENRGRLCPKGPAAVDIVYHSERLLKPLKKMSDGCFAEIPLEQAMDEIASKILKVKQQFGARALACWHGEGLGFFQQEKYPRRFIHAFGSPNFLSTYSVCYSSCDQAYRLVQGYYNESPNFQDADVTIVWGSNPPVAAFTFMQRIAEAQKRGAKLIVVDPRRNDIAKKADVHLRILPGTDSALAWGWVHHMLESNCFDAYFVENYSVGFQEFSSYAKGFTPDYVAKQTGLDVQQIIDCGKLIAERQPRVINFVGMAIQHQDNGMNTCRTIASFSGLCGSVDIQGGDTWPEGLGERELTLYEEIPLDDQKPIGSDTYPVLYQYNRECHTPTAIDYMLGEGSYPLRALIVAGANPVNTNPHAEKVAKAFSSLDLLVVRELFMTETAELAHYILPAASFLERSEIHVYLRHQWVSMSRKVIQIPGVVDEYTFWRGLAKRLDFADRYFPWESEQDVNRWLLEPTGIRLEDLELHPEGIRYKPIRYQKYHEQVFDTPSGKFEFASKYLEGLGYTAIPKYEQPYYKHSQSKDYPYVLITGSRKAVFQQSRYRNIQRFLRLYPHAEIEIHPEDAKTLGIRNGEDVCVTSETGTLVIAARIVSARDILPRIVQITHGWWRESNVNRVTFDSINDPVSGFPLISSVPVRLEKA